MSETKTEDNQGSEASHCYNAPCPKSYDFDDVNHFVHMENAQYEDLQNLCLSLAATMEASVRIEPEPARLAEASNTFIERLLDSLDRKDEKHQLWFKTWVGCLVTIQAEMERVYNDQIKKNLIGR